MAPSWEIGAAACDRREPDFYFLLPRKRRRTWNVVSRILDGETEHEVWSIELRRADPVDAVLGRSVGTWYAWSGRASDCLLAL
ncbi:MAG: hypothetical protein M3334_12620 [Actinomycetota bacterium]|nr:hypothetical protein [Actinomycetota bacterium]